MGSCAHFALLLLVISIGALSPAAAGEYELLEHKVGKLHLYRADPSEISLHWKGKDGTAYRTFSKVGAAILAEGRTPLMLNNAGIFESGGTPSGLHVEGGKELRPINLADAPKGKEYWNFYLKPTGVFWIGADGKAAVTESVAYVTVAKGLKEPPRLALQSGPLLLRGGAVHPHPEVFRIGNRSLLHRNGIGILPDGRVLFLMTDLLAGTRVNPRTFALLFKEFGCEDALFLDGDLSAMWVASEQKGEPKVDPERELAPGVVTGNNFGAVLAVTGEKP